MTQQCLNRHFSCTMQRYAVTFITMDGAKQTIHLNAVSEVHAKEKAKAQRVPAGGIKHVLSVRKEL